MRKKPHFDYTVKVWRFNAHLPENERVEVLEIILHPDGLFAKVVTAMEQSHKTGAHTSLFYCDDIEAVVASGQNMKFLRKAIRGTRRSMSDLGSALITLRGRPGGFPDQEDKEIGELNNVDQRIITMLGTAFTGPFPIETLISCVSKVLHEWNMKASAREQAFPSPSELTPGDQTVDAIQALERLCLTERSLDFLNGLRFGLAISKNEV